jgi:hypothetical protein
MKIARPSESEYDPFYAGYVGRVPEADILPVLETQVDAIRELATRVPPERETHRYAPEKWSVREIAGHLGDAERVFGYRAFCVSRGDQTSLPGFDEKLYVARSGYDARPLSELAQELVALRQSNLAFLRVLPESAWPLAGNANGSPVTLRALGYIMAGHVRHHLAVLEERYGI